MGPGARPTLVLGASSGMGVARRERARSSGFAAWRTSDVLAVDPAERLG